MSAGGPVSSTFEPKLGSRAITGQQYRVRRAPGERNPLAQRAGIPHTTLSALFNHGNVLRPATLRKLATAMGVPLGELLVLAGHLTRDELENPIKETDLARFYEFGDLTAVELEEVKDFARFVRSKRNAG